MPTPNCYVLEDNSELPTSCFPTSQVLELWAYAATSGCFLYKNEPFITRRQTVRKCFLRAIKPTL